jgi:hypothetical protein
VDAVHTLVKKLSESRVLWIVVIGAAVLSS